MKKKSIKKILKNDFAHNKDIRIILISIIIISLGVLIGTISYTVYKIGEYGNVLKHYTINSSVEVTANTVGLNADRGVLKYGKVTAGGGGTRYIDINTSEKAIVEFYITGNVSQYLSVENNGFFVDAGTNQRIPVTLIVPQEAPLGIYDGTVTIILRKA